MVHLRRIVLFSHPVFQSHELPVSPGSLQTPVVGLSARAPPIIPRKVAMPLTGRVELVGELLSHSARSVSEHYNYIYNHLVVSLSTKLFDARLAFEQSWLLSMQYLSRHASKLNPATPCSDFWASGLAGPPHEHQPINTTRFYS
jgi:hypothetical protein